MRILTIYQGTTATDFKQYPKIGMPLIDADDEQVQHTVMLNKKALGMGKIFWYHIQLDEIDPIAKTHKTIAVWTDSVEEKKPIILNARARPEGLSATKIKPATLGGNKVWHDLFMAPQTAQVVAVDEEIEVEEDLE